MSLNTPIPEEMPLNRSSAPSTSGSEQFAQPTDGPRKPHTSVSSQIPHDARPITRLELYATRIPQQWITPLCGASAGVASGFVTCPLDVIKTKLQAQGGFRARVNGKLVPSNILYRGMIGTARTIWREEGIRGMYRGLGPMLLGYLPTWAVYLTVYDRSREYYFDRCDNWWLARAYASLTAGACSTIVTNPVWVIKTRLMSQGSRSASDGFRAPWYYTSTLDAARKMYRTEGLRSFYSGLTPALLGLTHVAVQFPLYEFFKMRFTGLGMGEHSPNEGSHFIGVSAATFLSKVCASTATYPHEVVRTRLQTQQRSSPAHSPEGISFRGGIEHPNEGRRPGYGSSSDGMVNQPRYRGVIRTCKAILREEGWRAFYAGIGTNLVRAVPAAMTTMLTYEYLHKWIYRLQSEGKNVLAEVDTYTS